MIDAAVTAWEAAARPGARVGHHVEVHARIRSTNDRAREILAGGGPAGVAVVAEEQVAGRGRMGRRWVSPPSVNLTASVGLRPALAADAAWGLGPAVALAAWRACTTVAAVGLKWPNDLVSAADGRKVGGLLVETASDADRVSEAIAGVGINVNWAQADLPPELRDTATSLCELAAVTVDRAALLRSLLEALDDELAALEAGRSPLPRYRRALVTLGRAVRLETPTGPLEGVAVDLDERGALVLDVGGERRTITSGEVVRVRPSADR